jgi:hypothetical protein
MRGASSPIRAAAAPPRRWPPPRCRATPQHGGRAAPRPTPLTAADLLRPGARKAAAPHAACRRRRSALLRPPPSTAAGSLTPSLFLHWPAPPASSLKPFRRSTSLEAELAVEAELAA